MEPAGLYCAAGDFYIDPWRPVDRAIVTHAHSDHASAGHRNYLVSAEGEHVSRWRLGAAATIQTLAYGETASINGVRVSLHPAGHILGSAQIRLEHGGETWVVSGDYKTQPDPTCSPFEPVRCDVFITESTFGLPIYRWRDPRQVIDEVSDWWRVNRDAGRATVVYAYSLGKAQRVMMGVDASIGPIYTHGAVEGLNAAYRASGVALPATQRVSELERGHDFRGALIVAPPSAQSTTWLRRFGEYADAFASGWMQIRGVRRRRAVDRGITLSDHADWPGLISAIDATGARRVLVTHGYSEPLVRWLNERGIDAGTLRTAFTGEASGEEAGSADETSSAEANSADSDSTGTGSAAAAALDADANANANVPATVQ